MRDFPVFTTEFGVASLILKEVPYREEAYIIIQSALQPEELLKECVSFCRAVGAEKIYVRGHEIAEGYPLHVIIYEMRGKPRFDESQFEHLWPVTADTVGKWRQLMNERLKGVDNAGTLEKKEEQEILSSGGAYFVHRSGELLGAGWLDGDELKLIASVQKGTGERIMHTLLSTASCEQIRLQVASTNTPAIRLYERMGFVKTAELRRWYRVL